MPMRLWLHALRPSRTAVAALPGGLALLLAGLMGLPARLAVCLLEWKPRDYAPIEAFVRDQLRPDDVVCANYQAYYPAVQAAGEVIFAYGRPYHPAVAQGAVSVLLLAPRGLAEVQREVPGAWQEVARLEPRQYGEGYRWGRSRAYDLAVYRRSAGR